MNIALILNIVFISFFVIALFGFFYGLIAGIYCASFTTVFKFLLIIIFLFASNAISVSVGNIDLSRFIQTTININGTTIQVTTVYDTLCRIISASGVISPINGMTLYQTIITVTTQLISLVSFLIIMLFVLVFGDILGAIIYALSLRFAVKSHDVKKRKEYIEKMSKENKEVDEKKLKKYPKKGVRRLTGGLVGFVSSFLCVAITFSPLTSVVTTVNKATQNLSQEQVDSINNPTLSNVYSLMKQADQSALFKFYKGLGNADVMMMNVVTSGVVNGQKYSLIEAISNLLELIKPISESIGNGEHTFQIGNISIDLTKLLSEETVSEIINVLIKNNLLLGLFPLLLDLGLNNLDNISFIDKTEIDLTNIDFKDEISLINEFYSQLYQSGLVTSAINDINNIELDYSKKQNYINAFEKLGESKILSNNLAYIIQVMGEQIRLQTGQDIIKPDKDVYKDIDWSKELKNFATIIFDLMESFGIKKFDSKVFEQFTDLNALLKDEKKYSAVKKAIVGDGSDTYVGLLDLEIFKKGIDFTGLTLLLTTNITQIYDYVDKELLNEVSLTLEKDPLVLKSEMTMFLDVLPKILVDFDYANFDINNPEMVAQLTSILETVKDSLLMNTLLPNIIRNSLKNSGDPLFANIGVNNMSFETNDMIDDVISLLNLYPDVKELIDTFSKGKNLKEQLLNFNIPKFEEILVSLIGNKVINPAQVIGADGKVCYDYNINMIIKNLLTSDNLQMFGITIPQNIMDIRWSDQNNSEVKRLIQVFEVLQTNANLIIDDNNNITFESISGQLLEQVISSFAQSELIRPSLTTILNRNIAPIFEQFDLTLRYSAMSVDDWLIEAKALGQVLDIVNSTDQLKGMLTGADISQADWLSIDPNIINALLTNLYNSSLLGVVEDENGVVHDNLGTFLYYIVNKANLQSYFGYKTTSYDFSSVDILGGKRFEWSEKTSTFDLKDINNSLPQSRIVDYTISGEIKEFVDIFMEIQKVKVTYKDENNQEVVLTGIDALNSGYATGNDIRGPLLSTLDSEILKNSAVGAVSSVLTENKINIGKDQLSFSTINLLDFASYSDQEKRDELNKIVALYDFIGSRNLTEEEIASYPSGEAPNTTSTMNEIFTHLTKLTDNQFTQFKDFLDVISSSKLLSTVKLGEEMSFRNQLMYSFLNYSGLSTLIVDKKYQSNEESIKMQVETLVQGVTDWTAVNQGLIDMIKSIQGVENVSDISNPTVLLATNPVTNKRYIESLLNALNECELTHRAVPGMFDKIFNTELNMTADIQSYLTAHSFSTPKSMNFQVELGFNTQSVDFWKHDIQVLITNIEELVTTTGSNESFDIISKLKESYKIEPIVNILSNLYSMKFNKEYYIASVLYQMPGNKDTLIDMIITSQQGELQSLDIPTGLVEEKGYKLGYLIFDPLAPNGYNQELVQNIDRLLQTMKPSA